MRTYRNASRLRFRGSHLRPPEGGCTYGTPWLVPCIWWEPLPSKARATEGRYTLPAKRGSTAHCTANQGFSSRLNNLTAVQRHLSLVMCHLNFVHHELISFAQQCLHTRSALVQLWLQPEKQIYDDTDWVYLSLMYLMTFCNKHCSYRKETFEFLHKGKCTKSGQRNLNLESYKIYCFFAVANPNKGIMLILKKICIQDWLLIQVSSNLFQNTVCNWYRQCNI